MAIPFSAGVANVLREIQPYGQDRGSRHFPRKWDPQAGKQGGNETLHAWYRRCVDDYLGGYPGRSAIEENFAAFVSTRWVDESKLIYVSLQAIIVRNKNLKSYYENDSNQVQYFRLDYFASRVGEMFKEHQPHVHIAEDGAPWFPVDPTSTGNIIVDFFDFIYRNYYHDRWLDWAREVWARHAKQLAIAEDPFPAIVEAFKAHQVPALSTRYDGVWSIFDVSHLWSFHAATG